MPLSSVVVDVVESHVASPGPPKQPVAIFIYIYTQRTPLHRDVDARDVPRAAGLEVLDDGLELRHLLGLGVLVGRVLDELDARRGLDACGDIQRA